MIREYVEVNLTDKIVGLPNTAINSFELIVMNVKNLSEVLAYDINGNLFTKTWGDIVCTYAYDVNGFLITKTLSGVIPNGTPTVKTYIYSGGNLIGKTYGNG